MLTFVGSKNIENKDIPHRMKAMQIIYEEFNKQNTAQKERLKVGHSYAKVSCVKLTHCTAECTQPNFAHN